MSNIFIPIDYSTIKEKIPSGEDILYSTLCKITFVILNKSYTMNSHVVFTPNYIAFTHPKIDEFVSKSEGPLELNLLELGRLENLKGDSFRVGIFKLRLEREPNFESKDAFKERSKNFERTLLPVLVPAKKNYLSYLQAKTDKEKFEIKFEKEIIKQIPKLENQLKKL